MKKIPRFGNMRLYLIDSLAEVEFLIMLNLMKRIHIIQVWIEWAFSNIDKAEIQTSLFKLLPYL